MARHRKSLDCIYKKLSICLRGSCLVHMEHQKALPSLWTKFVIYLLHLSETKVVWNCVSRVHKSKKMEKTRRLIKA